MRARGRQRGLELRIYLAGRLALEADGRVVGDARFPGRQGRLLFAYLVCEQGTLVPREALAAALWGDAPPATSDKALSVLVSKLRTLLGEQGVDGARALTASFGCYRLDLPDDSWVDVLAAADAARTAEGALAAGDLAGAQAAASLAAAITRAPFLPGEDADWVEDKRRELADVRSRVLDVLADSSLRSGDAAESVKWAEQAVAHEPFRETGYRRLMAAHAAAGNRAEGLRVYERCRRLLADELGAYPSPETDSIYRALLEAPPPAPRERAATAVADSAESSPGALVRPELPPPPRGRASPRRRRVVAIAAVAVAAGVVATVVAMRHDSAAQPPTIAVNSIVSLNSSGSVAATVAVGARPVAISSSGGALWIANLDDQSVTRVDLASGQVTRHVPIGGSPTGVAATRSAIWVTDSGGRISKIDPTYDRLTETRRIDAFAPYSSGTTWPILAAFGSIWVVDPDGLLIQLDEKSARQIGSVDIGNEPSAIAAGADSLWVTNGADGTVTRIDPLTLLATTVPVGHGPAAVAVNDAGVWIANTGDNTLVRIDPETNAVAETLHLGDAVTALLATPAALWMANGDDGTVLRLDPHSGGVSRSIDVGGTPTALDSVAGQVWVTIAAAPPTAPTSGGVAHLTAQDDVPSLDPALSATSVAATSIHYATCANLVTYRDEPAPAGSRIVPEVAESVPTPSDGAKTYAFTIRHGFRFSPPSSAAVTAETFKATIERVTDPRLASPVAESFSDVVGYRAYVDGKASGLAGVTVQGPTLTIRLSRPDGGFLADLASGAACATPQGTPAVGGGLNDVPSAGPYYVASYTPRQQIVLRSNPNYGGDRPHHLAELVVAIGTGSARALREIKAGTADYALDGLPRDAGPRLESQYGPDSAAAKSGHQQYFISPALGVRYLHMNIRRSLFSDVRVRRAVNYAIDRAKLAAQGERFAEVNPFNAGAPTDDLLPPTIAGAADFKLYPVNGPDLARAQKLAGTLHATAIMYTPNLAPWLQEAQIVRQNLKPLGITVEIKEFPIGDFFTRIGRRDEPFDLAVSGWAFGSTDPAEALAIFDGSTISARDNSNFSYLDDPGLDRQIRSAAALSGARRYRAYEGLAFKVEKDLIPVAAFADNASRDFFSARMGCEVYQPVFGVDLAALCLRD
jgi:ABC-type transport system substrate-binding protein/DNA-binding SARP family transcriptional activator